MGIRHRLDTPIENVEELIYRAAAFARALRDHGDTGEHVLDTMVELGDQQILLLFCPPRGGDIASIGGCPSSVPLVEPNADQRQRQYGEARYRDADRHPTRWYGRPGHYYRRIAHDRCRPHCGEVEAEDRKREEKRTLEAVKECRVAGSDDQRGCAQSASECDRRRDQSFVPYDESGDVE